MLVLYCIPTLCIPIYLFKYASPPPFRRLTLPWQPSVSQSRGPRWWTLCGPSGRSNPPSWWPWSGTPPLGPSSGPSRRPSGSAYSRPSRPSRALCGRCTRRTPMLRNISRHPGNSHSVCITHLEQFGIKVRI